jgi:hypothetical protein
MWWSGTLLGRVPPSWAGCQPPEIMALVDVSQGVRGRQSLACESTLACELVEPITLHDSHALARFVEGEADEGAGDGVC